MTVEYFEKMKSPFASQEAYTQFFFTDLPAGLHFTQRIVEKELETIFDQGKQIAQNCARKSPDTCVRTFFIIQELKDRKMLGAKNFKSKSRAAITSSISVFNNWLLDQQLADLQHYLRTISAPNRKFVSNYELISKLCEKYQKIRNSDWIWPQLKEKMAQLETEFPNLLL